MDCAVRNISLSGARLGVDPTFALPIEFELEIPRRGAVLLCALKWRRDDTVGVKFLDREDLMPGAPTAAAMEELRRENVQLRQDNARLKGSFNPAHPRHGPASQERGAFFWCPKPSLPFPIGALLLKGVPSGLGANQCRKNQITIRRKPPRRRRQGVERDRRQRAFRG